VFEELRKIRKEKNIKAIDMAILIGLKTEGAYYKKETGQVPFTLEEGEMIATFLEMPMEKIFKKKLS